MTLSALVLTLSDEPGQRALLLAELALEPSLTLGELAGRKLPLVLESADVRAGRDAALALERRAGVERVEVVQIHFEDEA